MNIKTSATDSCCSKEQRCASSKAPWRRVAFSVLGVAGLGIGYWGLTQIEDSLSSGEARYGKPAGVDGESGPGGGAPAGDAGFPALAFESSTGAVVDLQTLVGKVWVANLFFTSCPGPCATASAKMRRLTQVFADDPRVGFLSISVDPATDTVERLAEYAKKYDADTARWHFLRADLEKVVALAQRYFRVTAAEEPNLHSTRFVLIDAKGSVQAQLSSEDPGIVEAMAERVRAILAGMKRGPVASRQQEPKG